jgi:glycosyltransferase involved in cell wall biosynthesis
MNSKPSKNEFGAANSPLVSIIVRTKDRPTALAAALDSLKEQRYRPIQLVVVNDGGQDVATVVDTYRHGFDDLIYIHHPSSKGRSVAANAGLDAATGEFIGFLDDDDLLHATHVDRLVASASDDIDVVYDNVQCMEPDADGQWQEVYRYNQPFDLTRLMVENYIPIHAVLFRRRLLDAGCRFDEGFDTFEDWDFWLQLAQHCSFHHLDQLGGIYRVDAESGFGVAGDKTRINQGLKQFFAKWQSRWSLTQIIKIAEYAKHFSMYHDLRRVLRANDVKMQDLHRAWQEVVAELDRYRQRHEDLTKRNARLSARNEALTRQVRDLVDQQLSLGVRLKASMREAEAKSQQLSALDAEHRLVLGSRSWRITRPLRQVTAYTQRMLQTRAIRILREEGLASMTRRSLNRIRSAGLSPEKTTLTEIPCIEIPILADDWSPLSTTPAEHPLCSVIVRDQPNPSTAFALMESIIDQGQNLPLEIIVLKDRHNEVLWSNIEGLHIIDQIPGEDRCDSFNRGAEAARGEFLIFIDGLIVDPPDAWVPELLASFDMDERIGLVGIRTIYEDGTLYEGGGIAWSDGRLQSYGHRDHPCKPEYSYFRRVDYCASSCIAMRRQAFQDVDGFAPDYLNYEYACAHLSLALREKGYHSFYQPALTAVEQKTWYCHESPTDTKSLVNHWSDRLVKHPQYGSPTAVVCRRYSARRILIIDAVMVTPDQDSGSLRMFNLLHVFKKLGFLPTFVASNLEQNAPYGRRLQQAGIEVLFAPFVYSIEAYLKDHGSSFDVVLVSRAKVARHFIEIIRKWSPEALLLYDTVDLHYLREEREAQLFGSESLKLKAADRKNEELAYAAAADLTLVVSPIEKRLLEQEPLDLKVEVVSNIHQIHGCKIEFGQREGLLFIGGFNHPPNVDAVIYFIQEVLPQVEAAIGKIPVHIVGSRAPDEIYALASDTVKVTGYVPDIEPYFNDCLLSVAPLRYGSGVKGKINMSMAYGLPVVATSLAAEGMYLRHEENVLIGDDAEAFAEGIVRLHRDEALWRKLSTNGIANVEKHFSAAAAEKAIERILTSRGIC